MSDSKKKYEEMLENAKGVGDIMVADYKYVMADEKEKEEQRRMDIIGQNGNDGFHYQQIEDRELSAVNKEDWNKLGDPDLLVKGNKDDKGSGLRFNTDKPRYDLLPLCLY
jgi:hypothetical protein